jgi:hypothetical protein
MFRARRGISPRPDRSFLIVRIREGIEQDIGLGTDFYPGPSENFFMLPIVIAGLCARIGDSPVPHEEQSCESIS